MTLAHRDARAEVLPADRRRPELDAARAPQVRHSRRPTASPASPSSAAEFAVPDGAKLSIVPGQPPSPTRSRASTCTPPSPSRSTTTRSRPSAGDPTTPRSPTSPERGSSHTSRSSRSTEARTRATRSSRRRRPAARSSARRATSRSAACFIPSAQYNAADRHAEGPQHASRCARRSRAARRPSRRELGLAVGARAVDAAPRACSTAVASGDEAAVRHPPLR